MTHNHFYDEYEIDPHDTALVTAEAVIEDVEVLFTGDRIAGFEKRTNPAEIARWHEENLIGYDPEHQRGFRVKYRDGVMESRDYLIKNDKVKAIARSLAENSAYNRFRIVNARIGHVRLYFEPYQADGTRGRLSLFRDPDSTSEFSGLLSTPDSAHRQKGDILFTRHAVDGIFSPEHAGFGPDTYDLILHITLTDRLGEGEAHYEHNELITKSTATRRSYLEGGLTHAENWVVHEMMRRDPDLKNSIEIYEKSISANSPKIVTFNTLAKGIAESWAEDLKDDRQEVARQVTAGLQMARRAVPEWGPLPFRLRKTERETKLYSQAIVQRALLHVLADLHAINRADGVAGDWARWAPMFETLKTRRYVFEGEPRFEGEFLSRDNPLFYAAGASIYQMNKKAREEKEEKGDGFVLDPKKHLTVQNTRLSLDTVYGHLSSWLGYRGSAAQAASQDSRPSDIRE